jgi:hypothetical protein
MRNKKLIYLILFLLGYGCTRINQFREENLYSPEEFKNYKISDSQDSALLCVASYLEEKSFLGGFGIVGDSIYFGASKNIEIPSAMIDALIKYRHVDKIYHDHGMTYFQLSGGFIDDNCGILYLKPREKFHPLVIKKRFLRKSGDGNGDWYFVETKL